jgi:uncharacterized membrane protein YkvA (DUF1232 family)
MSREAEYPLGDLPIAYSPPDERRFWRKVRRVVAHVPFAEDLLAAYFCAIDRDTPLRGILLGPPGFGDDASVSAAAVTAVGSHLRPQHRARARDRLDRVAG